MSASNGALSTLGLGALTYATELGWAVFPLLPRTKDPAVGPTKDRDTVLCKGGFHRATCHPEQISEWWDEMPDANIGLATGKVSGVYVVDLDGPDSGQALAQYGELAPVAIARTARGRHVYLESDLPARNSASRIAALIDVRGDGGYVVLPPSVHESGHVYTWELEPWPQ